MNPFAIEQVRVLGYPAENLRSKSWDEFALPGAPQMDFVLTVWPGQPVTAHWGFPDPAAVTGSDEQKRAAFAQTQRQMRTRVQLFLSLPLGTLDRMTIEKSVRAIGQEPL